MKADGGAVEGRKSLDPGGSRGCLPVSATAGASVDREPAVAEVSRQSLRADARRSKYRPRGTADAPSDGLPSKFCATRSARSARSWMLKAVFLFRHRPFMSGSGQNWLRS